MKEVGYVVNKIGDGHKVSLYSRESIYHGWKKYHDTGILSETQLDECLNKIKKSKFKAVYLGEGT